ncbi:single-stranded-DNA-specific exonuclease RecJ [Aureimonas frigidaquae]|uniref:single-stranded-DNA-specific exonuclease RecJ n=1 Tax=Aureimonas frigidaquae TaxID=424757 RepID=UPI000784D6A4|nr:single-stranded-DNA-specific exonuclease RecJ [Aureimonas frigidaquae]
MLDVTAERLFLNVEASLAGRRWLHALDARSEALATQMAQAHGLPDLVSRVLAARGVAPQDAARFMAPTIRELMPDPASLTDMDAASARIARAVASGERVAIFGDYDVDGAASAALLHRYLRHFGIDAPIRIPDRLAEGYGPNPQAMRALADAGASLIVTVDCGTTSPDAIAAVAGRADVVVLDHHQVGAQLPPAHAIVNPNRQDDLSGQGHLCAAGVVFLTLAAVSRQLRAKGRTDLPDLLQELDLAALATVCDVVPLIGFNRALVVRGLDVLRAQRNPGLAALARAARLSGPISAHHLGFLLGPRINAGGRIGDAALGSRLLTLTDANDAEDIAARLHTLNEERQHMERAMLDQAEAEVLAEMGAGDGPAVLVTAQPDWHPGIVGLIAARLKERFNRPAVAIAFDGAGRGTGSARSIAGFDMGALVRGALDRGILEKGGGHSMAAGLTIRRDRLGDFRDYAQAAAQGRVAALRAADGLRLDGALSARGLTVELAQTLHQAGPYGSGHPQPVFALPRHRIAGAQPFGAGGHVRARLQAADGASISAVAFRAAGTPLGERLLGGGDRPLHLAGSVSLDHYQGRPQVSFRIVDAAETLK